MARPKSAIQKDTLSLRGDRNKWIDFIAKCKKNKKTAWDVMEPVIDNYLKK